MKKKLMYRILYTYLLMAPLGIGASFISQDNDQNIIIEYENDNVNDNKKNDIQEQNALIFIESIDELKKYFDKNITIEQTKESLYQNKNIDYEYRCYTEEFIDLVNDRFPNIDWTVFNENLKIFKVLEIDKEEMQKDKKNKQASYRVLKTTIYMHNEHNDLEVKKYFYFHELWHMFNNLYLQDENVIYYKNSNSYVSNSTPIDEGMTTYLTEEIYNVPKLSSYPNQLDIVKILYEIYGEEMLDNYLNYGVEGIRNLIIESSDSKTAFTLFELMNQELEGTLDNSYPIYEILIFLCNEDTDYYNLSSILKNLNYVNKEKQPIIDLFLKNIYTVTFTENTRVTFDNQEYYNTSNLFYIELQNQEKIYLINNEILSNYFNTGYIRNIYDKEDVYVGNDNVLMRETFEEYFKLQNIDYEYDDVNDILVIAQEMIRGVSYVKSK